MRHANVRQLKFSRHYDHDLCNDQAIDPTNIIKYSVADKLYGAAFFWFRITSGKALMSVQGNLVSPAEIWKDSRQVTPIASADALKDVRDRQQLLKDISSDCCTP